MNTIFRKARVLFLLSIVFAMTAPLCKAQVPTPTHVVVVIMENTAYSQIIGSSNAPRINAIAADTNYAAVFTQSYAIEHPSQPNYLDFFAGSNQGVTDDNLPAGIPFTTAN